MRKGILIVAAAVALLIAITLFPGGQRNSPAKEEFFNYTVHFCPEESCIRVFAGQLSSSKESIRCAFYTADQSMIGNISSSEAAIAEVVFDERAKAIGSSTSQGKTLLYTAKSKGLMHSKYCVIDDSITITGSFNPTAAARSDSNNLLAINSTALSAFYSQDFSFLKNNSRQPKNLPEKAAVLNTTLVNVYFCPYDDCTSAVKGELQKARQSILFAAYSFTDPEIASELIIKKSEGIAIEGIMDKSTATSNYSMFKPLAANGIAVKLKKSKGLMHHKFFVIDNSTVITGSFNPTKNAGTRNNENLLIIRNAEISGRYAEEFRKIR